MKQLSKNNKEELNLFKTTVKQNFCFGNKNIIIIDSKKTIFRDFILNIQEFLAKSKITIETNILNEDNYRCKYSVVIV